MNQNRNLTAADIGTFIQEGDYVVDPMDNEIRQIASFTIYDFTYKNGDAGMNMVDGGVMGIKEIVRDNVHVDWCEAEGYAGTKK